VWCVCSVKTVWATPEHFSGEFVTMGRCTNVCLFVILLLVLENSRGPTYKSLASYFKSLFLFLDLKVVENCRGLCILQTVRYVSSEVLKFGYCHRAWGYNEEWLTYWLTSDISKYTDTCIYTPWTIKTCHFVFDYNSGVSCSIFIIFIPVETGRITLQFTYLMAWWRHNTVTTHIIKFFFIGVSSQN